MPTQQARIKIIGAADARPNDELDLLAFVEIGDRVGGGRTAGKGRNHRARYRDSHHGRFSIFTDSTGAKFVSRSRQRDNAGLKARATLRRVDQSNTTADPYPARPRWLRRSLHTAASAVT
jgi:hypothetical protein